LKYFKISLDFKKNVMEIVWVLLKSKEKEEGHILTANYLPKTFSTIF
jgi:hypothetical protein